MYEDEWLEGGYNCSIWTVSHLHYWCVEFDIFSLHSEMVFVVVIGGGELQLDSCMQSQFCTDSNTASLNVNEH